MLREGILAVLLCAAGSMGCAHRTAPLGHTQLPGCPAVWASTPDHPYLVAFRDRVSASWDPSFSRSIFGTGARQRDRYTIVTVTLDAGGRVTECRVTRPSGIDSLDTAVVAVVTRAGPFGAPPPEWSKNGTIRVPLGVYLGTGGENGFGPGTCAAGRTSRAAGPP